MIEALPRHEVGRAAWVVVVMQYLGRTALSKRIFSGLHRGGSANSSSSSPAPGWQLRSPGCENVEVTSVCARQGGPGPRAGVRRETRSPQRAHGARWKSVGQAAGARPGLGIVSPAEVPLRTRVGVRRRVVARPGDGGVTICSHAPAGSRRTRAPAAPRSARRARVDAPDVSSLITEAVCPVSDLAPRQAEYACVWGPCQEWRGSRLARAAASRLRPPSRLSRATRSDPRLLQRALGCPALCVGRRGVPSP